MILDWEKVEGIGWCRLQAQSPSPGSNVLLACKLATDSSLPVAWANNNDLRLTAERKSSSCCKVDLRSLVRRQHYDQYQNSMQDMRFHLAQKTDGVRIDDISLLEVLRAATVRLCARSKQSKARGGVSGGPLTSSRGFQPGFQNRRHF